MKINLRKKNHSFTLEIEDDGVGRDRAQEIEKPGKKDHKSMATAITRERLANLIKKHKQKILFEIIDLEDENGNAIGTKVVFAITLSL